MNCWVAIYKSAWVVLAVLLVIGLICVFVPKCRALRELQRRKACFVDENKAVKDQTRELRSKQERFVSDPDYVERVARESGMVRPDETVFRFTNEQSGGMLEPATP